MKNKDIQRNVSPLPEIELPGILGRLIHYIIYIQPVYWFAATSVILAIFIIFIPEAVWTALWKGIFTQGYLIIMLVIFCMLGLSLVWKTGLHIDVWVFSFINERGKRPKWLDWLMLCVSQLGNGIFAYILAFILFLRVRHLIGYELIFGTLTLWLTVELMKTIIRRPRPYSNLKDTVLSETKKRGILSPAAIPVRPFLWLQFWRIIFTPEFCWRLFFILLH